ncbi:unnamed protein product [Cladocopium goreaui]|uniref:ERAD-associated E3 ubiquitin-protein ligase HRD1 (HMG-CoA reductase degradation protein 1) (RING-type E3 ubiquitin transferase HRD1) n=1 Tax=Cladocopium goreaui TaxID=2562237 RepID=A0A9P1C8M2_9DINO|nr:unnamed protein product [Cladocopium goreaui]
MLPLYLFAIVMLMTSMTTFVGLYIPYRCTRQRVWLVMPTTNLVWSTLFSLVVNGSIIAVDYSFEEEIYDVINLVDHMIRLAVALAGLGMGFSMQIFLVHYMYVQEGAAVRRFRRWLWIKMVGTPAAQLIECEDLAAACPGECAICLEPLVCLPEHLALSPARGSKVSREVGLLRLPCEHTFHGSCADGWMIREVTCPLCRAPIGSLKRCQRICLRRGASRFGEGGETPSTPSVDVGDFFSVTWYGGICWHCGCRLVIMAVVDPHLGKGLQDLPPIGITGSHYLDDDPVGCVSPRMQQLQHPLVDEQ